MFDLSLPNLLIFIFIIIPLGIVVAGIVCGTLYAVYLLMKDIYTHFNNRMHHRGAH